MAERKLILHIDKGEEAGRTFELFPKGYRAVGRAGSSQTIQFTKDGDGALTDDDLGRLEEHLSKRPSRHRRPEPRLGNFVRGPDILVEDTKISRTHAMFFLDEDGPSVVDLYSTNGTMVNGEKVTDADLEDGDLVHIGQSRFVVQYP